MLYSERGISLFEVLVVVAVLATFAIVATPDLLTLRKQTVYGSVARELLGLMRLARTRAIARNLEQRVEIEVLNRRYRLMEGNRPTGSPHFETMVVDWIELPDEVSLKRNNDCNSDANRNLEFNPNGTSETGYVCIVETDAPEICHFKVGVSIATVGRPLIKTE